MMDENAVIEASHLSKSFDIRSPDKKTFFNFGMVKKAIINDLNFTIRKGEVVGIVGRNGSGKSTLLKIISGILKQTSGEITVRGNVASIIELGIGLQEDRTGIENIIIRGNLYGIPSEKMKELLPQIVKYADLGDYINNPLRMYSSGMKSRLAFAIMVAIEADIFIIDEALSTGDMSFRSKASRHIHNLVEKGKTVLMVSHDQRLMAKVCTRILELDRGKIVADGEPESVLRGYVSRYINDTELLASMAEAGIPSAQYYMAQKYKNANEDDKDDVVYNKWLTASAESGDPNGMCEYADNLMSEGRKEEAVEYYRRSSDEGNSAASWKYSALISGLDTSSLKKNLSFIAENGNHFDVFRLADLILNTSYTEVDYAHAFELMKKSADMGNLEAKSRLVSMYARGYGVTQSIEKACELTRELIKCGHRSTLLSITSGFPMEIVSHLSDSEIFECKLKLAMCGYCKFQFEVAKSYDEGRIVEKNEEMAKKWYDRYARSKIAQQILQSVRSIQPEDQKKYHSDEMLEFVAESLDAISVSEYAKREMMKKKPSDPKKLFELCKNVSSVSGEVVFYYAECLRLGIGTEINMTNLFSLYQIAADCGSRDAMYALSLMYKNGLGVKKNMGEYRRYMRMAADRAHPIAKSIVDNWNHSVYKKVAHIAYSKAKKYN